VAEQMNNAAENADFLAAHEDVVKRVLDKQPADEYLYDLAELFKVFGDTTRIRILCALFESELCVGDIALVIGLNQSTVSHQLKLLRDAGIVGCRRDGKVIYYTLINPVVERVMSLGTDYVGFLMSKYR